MYKGISNRHLRARKGHKLAHSDPAPQTADGQTPHYCICLLYPPDSTQLIYCLTALGKGERMTDRKQPGDHVLRRCEDYCLKSDYFAKRKGKHGVTNEGKN